MNQGDWPGECVMINCHPPPVKPEDDNKVNLNLFKLALIGSAYRAGPVIR